jgi:hypothetical protein
MYWKNTSTKSPLFLPQKNLKFSINFLFLFHCKVCSKVSFRCAVSHFLITYEALWRPTGYCNEGFLWWLSWNVGFLKIVDVQNKTRAGICSVAERSLKVVKLWKYKRCKIEHDSTRKNCKKCNIPCKSEKSEVIASARRCLSSRLTRWWTKKNNWKKWRAEEEERHKGSLTQKKTLQLLGTQIY